MATAWAPPEFSRLARRPAPQPVPAKTYVRPRKTPSARASGTRSRIRRPKRSEFTAMMAMAARGPPASDVTKVVRTEYGAYGIVVSRSTGRRSSSLESLIAYGPVFGRHRRLGGQGSGSLIQRRALAVGAQTQ